MESSGRSAIGRLFNEIAEIDRSESSYEIISEEIERLILVFQGQVSTLKELTRLDASMRSAFTSSDFYDARTAIRAELLILREAFLSGQDLEASKASRKSKAGRRREAFWDEMWAEIAAQISAGTLKPTKQRDIELAMEEWLNGRGGDTSVRNRARMLWDRMRTLD